MSTRVEHQALDGSVVVLEAEQLQLDLPATGVQRWMVDGAEREFSSGLPPFGPGVAAQYGIDFTESYSMDGGTLQLGLGENHLPDPELGYDLTVPIVVGSWTGSRYCVVAHIPTDRTSSMLELFARFRLTETAIGVVMAPRDPGVSPSRANPPRLLKEVEGLGVLIISPIASGDLESLPSVVGAPTGSGEAFCDRTEQGVPYLRVVGRTAMIQVLPDPRRFGPSARSQEEAALLSRLRELRTEWRAA